MTVQLVDYTELPFELSDHIHYQFNISGITRALLQEVIRHSFFLLDLPSTSDIEELTQRGFSLSVESTRYTLAKKLRFEQPFLNGSCLSDSLDELDLHTPDALERAQKYIKFTGNTPVDIASLQTLDNLRELVNMNISSDYIKYALGESWLVNLTMTIRYPMLLNLIKLRTSKDALWEFQDLANLILQTIPNEHKQLFSVT